MEPERKDVETLRAQLREAIQECRRQIDILKDPVRKGAVSGTKNSTEIALLEEELRRLCEALTELN
jgi:hypothetical protein